MQGVNAQSPHQTQDNSKGSSQLQNFPKVDQDYQDALKLNFIPYPTLNLSPPFLRTDVDPKSTL